MFLPNSNEWLLRRISPNCESSCGNEYYNINTSFRNLVVIIPLGRTQEIFRLICPICGETIELEVEEFRLIEPFIEVNKLLESGKIDEVEFRNRIDKIESRLLKLRRD
jgi:hypothetical protein